MKTKIIAVLTLTVILFSCASKTATTKSTPIAETKVVTETIPIELTTELAAGKMLFESNCAKCHKLPTPASHTELKWKPILVKMQKKAKLDDTQMAGISNYISSQL